MPVYNYVDTDYLYSFFIYKDSKIRRKLISKKHMDEEKVRHDVFKKLLYDRNNEVFIKVPLISMGELFNNIHNKCLNIDSQFLTFIYEEIFKTFRMDKIDVKSPTKNCYALSFKIMENDSRFHPTDALIVSQALLDQYSFALYSFDGIITQTYVDGIINELNIELCNDNIRNHELKVRPDVFS